MNAESLSPEEETTHDSLSIIDCSGKQVCMLVPYKGKKPKVHAGAFVAPGACVVGDVTIGDRSSVWFGAVLRADVMTIEIGSCTSIQDGAVVHGDHDKPVRIGNHVTVGHSAVLHGCTVEDASLIGMNATVLDGSVIGSGSIVAAGCVVTPKTIVPPNSLVAGVPGKIIKDLGETSREQRLQHAENYARLAADYMLAGQDEVKS